MNLLSRWPGEGLGGVVALGGLDELGKGAGEEGVEDVAEDGLLLESRWFVAGGRSCRDEGGRWQGLSPCCPACLPHPSPGPSLPCVKMKKPAQGIPTIYRSNI